MNKFEADNAWQRRMRDEILVPGLYDQCAIDGRYVLLDAGRLAGIMQSQFKCDTVLQGKGGQAVFIEEKIVRWPERDTPYTAYCLETHSCTKPGQETPGWMDRQHGSIADYALYACANKTEDALDAHLLRLPQLKDWFWPIHERFPVFQRETLNRSRGRVVPFEAIPAGILVWRRLILRPQPAEAAA